MSFRERSAWAMAAVLLVTGLLYLQIALGHSAEGSTEIHDLVHWVILVIIGFFTVLVGLMADLIGGNRALLEDILYRLRRMELKEGQSEAAPKPQPVTRKEFQRVEGGRQ